MDTLYIVMPAYNEEKNLKSVIDTWYPILLDKNKNSRLVINISGSTDKSFNLLNKLKIKFPQIHIINNSETENWHGAKVIELYDFSINNNADYIFQTDSDGQTDPNEFQKFWNLRKKFDIIIGKRIYREDGLFRGFVEKILCLLILIYFRVRVHDANAPFRLMKSSILKRYLYKMPTNYILPNAMLTTYFCHNRENLKFETISFKARRSGKSNVNFLRLIKIGLKTLHDFYYLRKSM